MIDQKTVFVVMSAEIFHPGHLNIIKVARDLGEVTVGLATDRFNARYKRLTLMSYEDRKAIVENINGVKNVIAQDTLDLAPILRELRPDYFVHGDDWKFGPLKAVRQQVLEVMQEWGGVLVEPPYTEGISSTKLNAAWRSIGATPETRIRHFRRMLEFQPVVRLLEVHNSLSGIIIERTLVEGNERDKEFDGMWYSDLTDSLAKGKPNSSFVDLTSRINTIHGILESTTKPLIVEAGNGGITEHFVSTVKTLERLGVSAVVIADKVGYEGAVFSLNGNEPVQEDVNDFARKIASGKKTQVNKDFSIITQINSLVMHEDVENALRRARVYIEAGVDALMIHSNVETLTDFFEFCRSYRNLEDKVPLLAAIPARSSLDEDQLISAGVQFIVYPDQLLRAAYTSMLNAAKTLLIQARASDVDELYAPISEICDFVPGAWGQGGKAD
jgi:phosphoenolpyruvate phosphomutase